MNLGPGDDRLFAVQDRGERMINPSPHALSSLTLLLTLLLSKTTLSDTNTSLDISCHDTKPLIMLVAGHTLDAGRMRDYAIALQH